MEEPNNSYESMKNKHGSLAKSTNKINLETTRIKKIISPVDFSEAASNAVEYAAKLAVFFDAELTLLHAVNEMAFRNIFNAKNELSSDAKMKRVKKRLSVYCAETADKYAVECKPLVKVFSTDMETGIDEEVVTKNYDLLVMGTHGTRNEGQYFLNANAYGVIRKVSCPLWLVPEGCKFTKPQDIVYATNYQAGDLAALESLLKITKPFHSEITVLHASKKQTKKSKDVFVFFQDLYRDKLAGQKLKFQRLVGDNLAKAIDNYMIKGTPDLLVLLTHHYSILETIFHDSFTKKVSLSARYPVLINKTY